MALALSNNESTEVALKPKVDPMVEVKKMQLTRGGGTYIPPHRLRAMMAEQEAEDKEGEGFQRMSWEALKKSINGLINKVNVANIKLLVPEVSFLLLTYPIIRRTLTDVHVLRSCSARI